MNIIRDISTAVKLTGEIRDARKAGCDVRIVIDRMPTAYRNRKPDLWGWTMESTLFSGDLGHAIHTVFKAFDEPTQHALTFAPASGEWPARIQLWENALCDALTPEQFSAAMLRLSEHRTKCECA